VTARVLIVEDEPLIRRLLVSVLVRQGLEVEQCGDGVEGLALIRSGRFGVVVLDLMLPGVSGYDIVSECAASLAPPRPIFVVMTAFEAAYRKALDAKLVTAVITKPFDVEMVAAIIRESADAWTAARPDSAGASEIAFPPPLRQPRAEEPTA
jgi:CheY-like chemotaxis protein